MQEVAQQKGRKQSLSNVLQQYRSESFRAEIDKCWDQVFGSGGTSTLGASTTSRASGSSSVHGGVSKL